MGKANGETSGVAETATYNPDTGCRASNDCKGRLEARRSRLSGRDDAVSDIAAQTDSPRTAAANAARVQYLAERAAQDPVKLARAARVVRAALERGRITVDDLLEPERGTVAR